MKWNWLAASLSIGLAMVAPFPSGAQTAPDNGTDPTRLRRTIWTSYEHLDLGFDASRGTLKLMYEAPVSAKTALRLTLPGVSFDAPGGNQHLDFGDVSLRATHLLSVNPERGIVLQGEVYADTAAHAGSGYGSAVLKGTVIYAKFLQGGRIFAPALSHVQSINGDNQVRETTIDFYYVPKLPDPNWYMTVDPAIVSDWEQDRTYANIAVTTGRTVGKIGGGAAQIYLKPAIFIGTDRPADWSLETGLRVIGF